MAEGNIVDMHCDTISRLMLPGVREAGEGLYENTGHLDIVRMKEAGYLLQNFALFVDGGKDRPCWEWVRTLYRKFCEEMEANSQWISQVFCYEDIEENMRCGRLSALLTVEEGAVCGGRIERLEKLYRWGVRMLTLTWNYTNELGEPNVQKPNTTGGLTALGKEFVVCMEELGMIPDVSHLSDAGFYDVLRITVKPFVASHSNARAVCPHVRNVTDDMIRKLAERGGVMGLNFYPDFLEKRLQGEPNPGTIEAIVSHAKHIAKVGGIGVLGLGSDFDGINGHAQLQGVQGMGKLWEAMKRAGFSERQLDMIFGKNVLRVYRDTLSRGEQ